MSRATRKSGLCPTHQRQLRLGHVVLAHGSGQPFVLQPDRVRAPAEPPLNVVLSGTGLTIAMKLEGSMNSREHWSARAKRVAAERERATAALLRFPSILADARVIVGSHAFGGPRLLVRMTRISPRKVDSDNLPGRLKGVRDAIAAALGWDDGNDVYEWVCAQRKANQDEPQHAVRIEFGEVER